MRDLTATAATQLADAAPPRRRTSPSACRWRSGGGRGGTAVVTPVPRDGEAAVPTRADAGLVKALARAFRYQRLLGEGRYAAIRKMTEAERIERGHAGRCCG